MSNPQSEQAALEACTDQAEMLLRDFVSRNTDASNELVGLLNTSDESCCEVFAMASKNRGVRQAIAAAASCGLMRALDGIRRATLEAAS